ncbi:hypothetical protein [Cohnella mopanensis]|uniref:hypothetical protein n=1 Tax=Cohnella mopanensis TaxID=2911966 RepID=UPI001EF92129|nr:hypothetical protein [Cohnella mopanensis]
MNRVIGIVRTHLADRWAWLVLPWVIMGMSFVCNLIIGSLADDKIYTGGLASIYVYLFVLGIVTVGQTFPFIIGFGARRKDYFLGTIASITIISVLSAIVLIILGYIERQTGYWGVGLYFFNVRYLSDGPILERFWVYFTMMINLYFCGFAISSIHRKFGRNGVFFFFIGLGVVLTAASYFISKYDKWKAIIDWFADLAVIELANGLFVGTLICILVSYVLLRKATV